MKEEDALHKHTDDLSSPGKTDMCPSVITSELKRGLDINSDTMNSARHRVHAEVIGSDLQKKPKGWQKLFCFHYVINLRR